MKKFFLYLTLLSILSCAAADKGASAKDSAASLYDDFPIQILRSLTTCGANTCTFAVQVQMPSKRLAKLVCYFKPQGLNIQPVIMDTFGKPQNFFADIIQTTVSKTCRTTGKPDEMTINCGTSSFVWSTPVDMSDPNVAQYVYRAISDKIEFLCNAE